MLFWVRVSRIFRRSHMNQSELVPILASDVDTLLQISRKIFIDSFDHLNKPENMKVYMDRAFTRDKLLAELLNPLSEFYFLYVENRVAGYLKLNKFGAQSDLNDTESLEIERIYVDQLYQGQGLGAKLIDATKQRARELQLRYIWLGVWEKNPAAIRFYERHGFTIFSSHPFVFGDEVQTDLLMRHEIKL